MALELTCCCACGIEFALPELKLRQLRETKGPFWCPNGHSLEFKGESATDKIQRLVREKYEESERRARTEKELESLRNKMKRRKPKR